MARLRSLLPRIVALTLVGTALPLVLAAPASAARAKTVRIADAAIVEGNAGQQNLSFRLTWTGSKGGPAPSVQFATADVSATAGGRLHVDHRDRHALQRRLPLHDRSTSRSRATSPPKARRPSS